MYVYPKNGHQYMPLYRCRMKCPASGEWFDALIYQDCKTENLYVRDRKDFLDKFVKLEVAMGLILIVISTLYGVASYYYSKQLNKYKNGNNSKQGVSETD